MSAQATFAIEANGLVKTFGDTRAVDGVDLEVPRGAVYGVLGPNGAGKTTTIRMLATLLRPDAGSATVLGHDIVREADAVRGLVSLTGQLASVDEDLTGRENLILLGRLLGYSRPRSKERAAELLDAFGLADAASRQVKNYSGGMRRRLDIAASIVVTPELMFLDEPTTGLDPRSRNQVWDIIRALVGEGTTVLLCTQYLDEADQLAERIAVIDHGRVIAEGTPGELKASVGQGTLHIRVLDPEQRDEAERVLARALDASVHLESDPAALSVPVEDAERASEAVAALFAAGHRGQQLLARPAQPRRGLPGPHRPSRRRGREDRGARRMSTPPETRAQPKPLVSEALHKALAAGERPPRPSALSACLTFGWRGILKIKHVPEQLIDVSITPVLFLLMFTYLFGGAVAGSTQEYLQFLLPGVLVQSVLFTSVYSGVSLNTDVTKGVVDRFRSLPLWRPAPLVGAVVGDSVRYVIAATVVVVLGFIMGFDAAGGPSGVILAIAARRACSRSACRGSSRSSGCCMRAPSAVMNTGFMALFPLVFLSNIFVEPDTLPSWLEWFVGVNPISYLTTATRGLMQGNVDGSDVAVVLAWAAGLTALFAPLTVRLYRNKN